MNKEHLDNVEHSVVALYALNVRPESIESVYNHVLAWMSRFRCKPDLMGTDHDKGKLLRFRNSEKKMLAAGFGSLSHFSVISLREDVENELQGEKSHIVYRVDPRQSRLLIDFESGIVEIGSADFISLAREACNLANPTYGIGYRRKFGLGPMWYALNMSYGPEEYEEELRISHWGEALRFDLCNCGLLRDIYPWSFLTSPQLNRGVGDLSLQQWIEKDSHRGKLSPLTDRVTLWEVRREYIPAVREALFRADVIFDYAKHIGGAQDMFKYTIRPDQRTKEFFQAWVTKKPEEMKRWFREQYGTDRLPSEPLTGEQVLGAVLKGFGYESPADVRILETKGRGKVEEVSREKTRDILEKTKKKQRKK